MHTAPAVLVCNVSVPPAAMLMYAGARGSRSVDLAQSTGRSDGGDGVCPVTDGDVEGSDCVPGASDPDLKDFSGAVHRVDDRSRIGGGIHNEADSLHAACGSAISHGETPVEKRVACLRGYANTPRAQRDIEVCLHVRLSDVHVDGATRTGDSIFALCQTAGQA